MKKSRFSESQTIHLLMQAEAGIPVPELCREHGMSSALFYRWRSKFAGMDASMMTHMKELEEENRRLKKMYAEEHLKAEMITRPCKKSDKAIVPARDDPMGSTTIDRQHSPGLPDARHQPNLLSPPCQPIGYAQPFPAS